MGELAALAAQSSPGKGPTSPGGIVNLLISALLLALLVLFAMIGLRGAWTALIADKTKERRSSLEGYLVVALSVLFLVAPLSVNAAVLHGTTPTILLVVLPTIFNLLVGLRAVRAVVDMRELMEPAAHYLVVGASLGVILFIGIGCSYFAVLPKQLLDATDAIILAATLLLVPEAIYLLLVVAAAKRRVAGVGRKGTSPGAEPTVVPVDLTIKLTRGRFGIVQEARVVGSVPAPAAAGGPRA